MFVECLPPVPRDAKWLKLVQKADRQGDGVSHVSPQAKRVCATA